MFLDHGFNTKPPLSFLLSDPTGKAGACVRATTPNTAATTRGCSHLTLCCNVAGLNQGRIQNVFLLDDGLNFRGGVPV